jgi:putative transposase
VGYVVMPDHVHAIVWFPATNQLSNLLKQWKQRSSAQIKDLLRSRLIEYASKIDLVQPIWQRKFYAYNLFTTGKMKEKLDYMHLNPVRAGLTRKAVDWRWSSARYYELLEPVDIAVRWVE